MKRQGQEECHLLVLVTTIAQDLFQESYMSEDSSMNQWQLHLSQDGVSQGMGISSPSLYVLLQVPRVTS